MTVKRISPAAARSRMLADDATLICAYESREDCLKYRIEGSISLAEFMERLPSFPETREFIFYCA